MSETAPERENCDHPLDACDGEKCWYCGWVYAAEAPAYGPQGRWTQLRAERDAYREILEEMAEWIDYMERPGPLAIVSRERIRAVLAGDHDQGAQT